MEDISPYTFGKGKGTKMASIIPKQDLEDHFLRLEEIFGCLVMYSYKEEYEEGLIHPNLITIGFFALDDKDKHRKSEILEEILQAKRRIESIYPVIVEIDKKKITNSNEYMVLHITPKEKISELHNESTHERLSSIITIDESEDYFLRLKEVYNCTIELSELNVGRGCFYGIKVLNDDNLYTKELVEIKHRMEIIYPKLAICTIVFCRNNIISPKKISYTFIYKKSNQVCKNYIERIIKDCRGIWTPLDDIKINESNS